METTPTYFKFAHDPTTSDFSRALMRRVDAYFVTRGVTRHATLEMVGKTILGFVLWIGTYLWLVSATLSPAAFIAVFVLHGFTQLYLAFNIAHDANHGAYSKHRGVNRVLSCVFDIVGVSSYMWRLLHNDSHHAFVNVHGADTTFISGRLFRFSERDKRRPFHRYQHLYAPLVYSLSTLDWVLTKDYRWLFNTRFGNRTVTAHPLGEMLVLFAGKAFYYTYNLVIPMLYLDLPWYVVIGGFTVMHLCTGFTIALIFQPNHFNADSTFPEPDERGRLANNYIRHILDTTADYARGNAMVTWVLGGLNLHVIHHMFPRICHVHYPALTRIIRDTADEYGLSYREARTLTAAFLAHLRWLKTLGGVDQGVRSAGQAGLAREPL